MALLAAIMAAAAGRSTRVGDVGAERACIGGGSKLFGSESGCGGGGGGLALLEGLLGFAVLFAGFVRDPVFSLDGPRAGLTFGPGGSDHFVGGVRVRIEGDVVTHHCGYA